ncbi:hypothetical protein AQF52_7325 [Streptomyces venezuelae]|uniref:hypothetical protein n=1 Tax=Streptomyces gardneri TaxID=66892 RepID=UPI0006BDFEE7|nr:hypothetical protein [Streptomyces gardneri]ALO12911.1 hypothetical protein AQF52_7325 [Streptomyces venezuelae]QPK49609.1 hypothetical protein H4W23_36740 [Streptomyces gardneri]WRK41158.1 hypothetical protein U0M97_36970 [Streptomyces venezuelae]CUM36427.1 hypothetical protein BN2537_1819 [Streptomyces venezuelae]
MTTTHGVAGCLCRIVGNIDDGGHDWKRVSTCPYHGVLAPMLPDRTDTGMYRVVNLSTPLDGPECPPGVHSMFDPCPGGCLGNELGEPCIVAKDCGVHGTGTVEIIRTGPPAPRLPPRPDNRRRRRYRHSPGHWGVGIARSPGGWHVTVGPWYWTTEGAY